jgi:hypothetical protein
LGYTRIKLYVYPDITLRSLCNYVKERKNFD